MNMYRSCLIVLSFVSCAIFGMKKEIVISKNLPKTAQHVFERASQYCCDELTSEQKWYGLMCAVWYEDVSMVQRLLVRYALDDGAISFEKERMSALKCGRNHYHSKYQTFARIDSVPLTLAKYKKNQEIIALLEKESSFENSMCPVYALATYLGDVHLLQECIDKGEFNPEYYNERGGSLLLMAVREGHEDIVERLLQIDTIRENINSCTYLFDASDYPDYYVPVNEYVKFYPPVLWVAASRGHCSIVAQLLKVPGIDVKAEYAPTGGCNSLSALCTAAEHNHTDVVVLLCQQPATDVNSVDSDSGNSSLHYAAQNKNVAMMEILLQHGADRTKKNNWGKLTALDIVEGKIPKIPADLQKMMDLLKDAQLKKEMKL